MDEHVDWEGAAILKSITSCLGLWRFGGFLFVWLVLGGLNIRIAKRFDFFLEIKFPLWENEFLAESRCP